MSKFRTRSREKANEFPGERVPDAFRTQIERELRSVRLFLCAVLYISIKLLWDCNPPRYLAKPLARCGSYHSRRNFPIMLRSEH